MVVSMIGFHVLQVDQAESVKCMSKTSNAIYNIHNYYLIFKDFESIKSLQCSIHKNT